MNKKLLILTAVMITITSSVFATDTIVVNKNVLITNTGEHNIISYKHESSLGAFLDGYVQNFASTVNGSLNSIESENYSQRSGIANSIVGTANRTSGSNGSTIVGAGNEIIGYASTSLGLTKFKSYDSIEKMAEDFRENINKTGGGGSTIAIGTGNKARMTSRTSIIGVNNTVTGKNNNPSASNFVAGGANDGINVNHMTVIGSNNSVSDATDTIIVGLNRGIEGGNHVIILGSKDEGTVINVDDAVSIGHNADVNVEGGIALGSNSKATVNKVAVGYSANGNTNSTWKATTAAVSVGDVNNNVTRQITSVAAGTNDTDAVNVAQLKEVETKINDIGSNTLNKANNYTDSQVASVGAQSAALAGLHPLDFNKDDKASYAASVGHYRNANAVAVGAFYRPNERTMVSGAISFGRHNQMNLGVAFKTGKGAEYINEVKTKDSRIEKLEALVDKLTAEVAELKASK